MAWYEQTSDFLSDILANHRVQLPMVALTGASVTLALLLRSLLADNHVEGNILHSPRSTVLPSLSDNETRTLPLPVDVLPGGRDVASPYGTIRVYEWGPEDGPKVLLVHGITTPCVSLGGVAHALADMGCRVMTFDLYVVDNRAEILGLLIANGRLTTGLDVATRIALLICPRMTDCSRRRSSWP